MIFKARYKTGTDSEYQLLDTHLEETGMYAELFARDIGLPKPALLAALVHDLGKGCQTWAEYLEKNHKNGRKGEKEDHGTAGGQYLYKAIIENFGSDGELLGQLLSACVMYHHGPGLPDVIQLDGTARLHKRINIKREDTHVDEAAANLAPSIRQKIEAMLNDKNFMDETTLTMEKLTETEIKEAGYFYLGLTARFLSSCLIDADRRSSALYDRGIPARKEDVIVRADWAALRKCLEKKLAEFPGEGKLNGIRRMVSEGCAGLAEREGGIYTLTAATGTGKTLASLRYALVHAERTGKNRIFIIAPYTSILDQNAEVIRRILDPQGKNGQIILEHHSNLEQSERTEYFMDASDTWNAPIIITTMVQFLEALFGSGTRKIRRMHQLANSVIVFDEVQTLPVSCTYLFTWALRYLCEKANVSALLCTATQPGFNLLKNDYALPLPVENEVIPDIVQHFEDLKRVEIIDKTKPGGWSLDDAADHIENMEEQSILTVVNTKAQARKLFANILEKHPGWQVVHLSANMCPAHRKDIIEQLKKHIQNKAKKCVCISTRLIEAGVDIDFDGAIRFLAGFDSIIQTGGRCNRNGNLENSAGNPITGKTYIVNIVKDEENITSLPDLVRGQQIMERILREFHDDEAKYNHTLLHPELIARYFKYFYGQLPDSLMKHQMYRGRNDTVLDLLSDNAESVAEYRRAAEKEQGGRLTRFRQSFESAWKAFEVIEKDTFGVIVPYQRGTGIIAAFYALPDGERCAELLREAQQYSVNVYTGMINRLLEKNIIKKVPLKADWDIYTVDETHYDRDTGLSDKEGLMTPQIQ